MTGPRLAGKVALVTGAGGGIGLEAVRLFTSEAALVIAVDALDDRRDAIIEVAAGASDSVSFFAADVSDDAQVQEMIRFAVAEGNGLHVLFNNAGIFPTDDAGVTETPEPTWDRVMNVNLKGVWLGCKHGIPAMVESGGGSIVNVASFVALMGAATAQIAYTASKGGVLAMTREIAVEYARRGIRANAICPGPIDTPLLAPIMSDPEKRARRLVHIPMGRLGRPEEIAKAALFLASDEASFVTGTALIVDGGITAAYVTPEETEEP